MLEVKGQGYSRPKYVVAKVSTSTLLISIVQYYVTAIDGGRPRSKVCERGDGLKNLTLKACYGGRWRAQC